MADSWNRANPPLENMVVHPYVTPLVDQLKVLEKFPGKGGWTYVSLPEVPYENRFPFGMLRVCGSLDGYELGTVRLMPKGKRELFLPVNAGIRKALGKEAGAEVRVKLYKVPTPTAIPEELLACFRDSPGSLERFRSLSLQKQTLYLEDMEDAKTPEKQAAVILRLLRLLEKLSS
ncbi:Bacteriocin-protection, YdeI or OmpD-Associated [Cyclobacterium xiamenense]|uniref:Bacteriocin-protection, YdeI or OmpD-Associated n=1 Tax=Cyclobacterium xiamenense TaxID=1297121 RepID=A0A1H7AYC8_9BACT|nr:YdeI/OmpD-associated family protein [Cyclobacterium xiamenense]SEJ70631.1 Bacteriocin-protection, YdeI or OmpD-Associated [Cyclobacterium xiamenense]